MVLKKNKKGQMEATDQYGKLAEDYPKKTYQVGGKQLSKEEYNTTKGQLGMKSGKGGVLTPGVQEAVGNVQAKEAEIMRLRKAGPAPTAEEMALVNQIGQPTVQEGPELQDLTKTANIKSAASGFAVEAAPTVLGAAATGAAAGAIGGSVVPGLGTAAGAIVGGAAGAVSGLLYKAISNVKAEAKEDTLSTSVNFNTANSNLGSVVTALNRGYISQEEAIQLYRKQLAIIDRSERQLKELTKNNLNEFLSDGSTEMAKIAAFNSPGGEREFWDLRMKAALLKPDPTYGTQNTGAVQ